MAERILSKYYIAGGRPAGSPYRIVPMLARVNSREATELLIVSNFVEVALAREGHANPVGVNCMEKLQLPLLASLYGSMLAGAGYILMGAGIPLKVPGVLDAFAAGQAGSYPLSVSGAQPDDDCLMRFDPQEFFGVPMPPLERPYFLAIISSNTLATTMVRRSNGKVDGFVIEGPSAGGHNAPPRGQMVLSEKGEAVYGERDRVDLEKIRQIGVPFWLAGSYGTPEKIVEALELGATGVQVGTAFAFCEESGLREDYKSALMKKIQARRSFGLHRSALLAHGFSFQGGATGGDDLRGGGIPQPQTRLRHWHFARGLPHPQRHNCLSLPIRTGRHLCSQGRSF